MSGITTEVFKIKQVTMFQQQLLCLMRFAEVDQVQGTFIDMATFEKCKNVNGRFNENTLRTAVKMC